MKLSKEILAQIKRLSDMGSYHLTRPQKQELAIYADHIGARPLKNLDCGTCVRDTMHSVNHIHTQKQTTPILQKREPVKMTMDVKPEQLKWSELKQLAKAKGISTHKKTKKDILNELSKAN